MVKPHRKIRLRSPVPSIRMLPGTDIRDATNGSAVNRPNWKFDAPSPWANTVKAEPVVVVYHTDPNTHASVIKANWSLSVTLGRIGGLTSCAGLPAAAWHD